MTAKAMNKKQLAELYKVSLKTFNSWIKPFRRKIGPQLGKVYTPRQVRIIFDCLGEP